MKDSSDFNNALNTHFILARISMVISGRMKGIPFFHRVPQIENISKFSISIRSKKKVFPRRAGSLKGDHIPL